MLLLLLAFQASALENRLANHPSPYLALHGDDPVHWQDWSRETLELAKKENKLLFISSGYFACHWCHVMRRESYNNPKIAELLNRYFIPVKLDRELDPALDDHLIDFVQRTQGSAGWPLNVFVTPEGYPLAGMTYAPPADFLEILNRVIKAWSDESDQMRDLARRGLLALMQAREPAQAKKLLNKNELQQAFDQGVSQLADDMLGGFGQANRFPMAPQLKVLLEMEARSPDYKRREFLLLTLDQMANNGLRDQLAGGFYRYTVDPSWHTPHYEKMLYTQALLAELYMEGAAVLNRPDYLAVAEDTLDFVKKTMLGDKGGYLASFSAVDDKDVEGGYYLWQQQELEEILSKELLPVARIYWRLDEKDETVDGTLPRGGIPIKEVASELELAPGEVKGRVEEARRALLAARAKRVLPVDDKQLAGWNGLMLGAFATGSKVLNRPDFARAAKGLRDFLVKELWDGKALYRAKQGNKPLGAASIQDYTYVADGLAKWAQVSGSKGDAELSKRLLRLAWQKYHTRDGWLSSDQALLPGMPRSHAQEDGALPSPAALVIHLSLKSGDQKLEQLASETRADTLAAIQQQPFWYASHTDILLSAVKGKPTGGSAR